MSDVLDRLKSALADRYSIERELGSGGMATVYLARDLRHERDVAVKVLRAELAAAMGADRFLREIKLTAKLNHPHILPLLDSGEADGFLYYVMPYVAGESLRQRLERETQLPVDEALRITQQVIAALDFAHRQGVIHRDIKPENVLLHEGEAMVADFGIALAVSAAGGERLTETGVSVGTVEYMSPEQALGEGEPDARSDVYSLGCVLYEMLVGEPPYTGPTGMAVLAKRLSDPVPSVRRLRAAIPASVDAALVRALAKERADRFGSAREFAEALVAGEAGEDVEAVKAIAVLPFANMSADPENEYFSDGMSEEIINALAHVPGVQVVSRTSSFAFKGKDVDVREIGEKLGVGTVLEGSVRKVGNQIRLTAQLVDVKDGYHLWSETYDRRLEDVFAIQDDISAAIVDALKVQLVGDTGQFVAPTTENVEAYNLYLKGLFFLNKVSEPDLRRALEFFHRALEKDPGYARAFSGIAGCWSNLADDWVRPDDAYPRARAAATRALELEPGLADALTYIGGVLSWYEWDFAGAERELRKAVLLNPNHADAHFVLGSVLPSVGQLDKGIEEMRKALVLDPLMPHHSRWLGRFLLYAKDYIGAIEQNKKTLELNPNYFQAYLDIGSAYLGLGQAEEALKCYRRGQSLQTSVRSYDAFIVRALAQLDEREEASAILERLEEEGKQRYVRSEVLAMGYAALGEYDRAFGCLEDALEARSAGLCYLHLDPGYEPLRSDPRFTALVKKVGVK